MKFLGIDYGSKRIGLAISDENAQIAFPKEIILTHDHPLEHIAKILKQENITEVVVGESINFEGEANKIEKDIDVFVQDLKRVLNVVVHKQKEFLTSLLCGLGGLRGLNKGVFGTSHQKLPTLQNK